MKRLHLKSCNIVCRLSGEFAQNALNDVQSCTKLHSSNLMLLSLLLRDARSAKRGIAIVGRPSVRPSVCLSVCDVGVPWAYSWVTSKVIARIISCGSSMPQHPQCSQRQHPQNSGGIGLRSIFSAENLQYL